MEMNKINADNMTSVFSAAFTASLQMHLLTSELVSAVGTLCFYFGTWGETQIGKPKTKCGGFYSQPADSLHTAVGRMSKRSN